jgi:translocation and assembly module TamA
LGDLYQGLLGSGYFDDVVVKAGEADPVAKSIPIAVNLATGRATRTRVGAGYSTDLGPSILVGRNGRLVNRRGHQYNLDLSMSPVKMQLGGMYRIPKGDKTNGWLSLYGGYLAENTDTSKTNRTTLGVRRIIPLDKAWVETLFFEVVNQQFESGGDQSNLSLVPGISLTHTETGGSIARPVRAHRVGIELSGTTTRIRSTLDFFSVLVTGRMIESIGSRVRFLGRGRIGLTKTDQFDQLPPSVRFFSGGDDHVRGYGFEQLGVTDSDGRVVGGDRLIEGSVEFDFKVNPRWGIAAFVDAGSVSRAAFSDSFAKGVGIGARWYSPIGPLRFDIAKPLDVNGGLRLHISFGPDI